MNALHEVELLRVQLPLVTPFRTARNTTAVKDALLVRVQTSAGVGWGECTAMSTPEYDGETLDGEHAALRDLLVPRAFSGAPVRDVPGHRAAHAALECALLDAQLRGDGVSLAAWLGAEHAAVPAGVAVGLADSVEALRAVVRAAVNAGYGRIKCKIEPGNDIDALYAARAEIGTHVQLAADANGSYHVDDAWQLFGAIDQLALQCVEQPCAADAIAAHTALVSDVNTPICLDETITGLAAAEDAIARHACDAIAVKVGRLGIAGAKRVHDACVGAGVAALAGGMLETGVGRAALVAVAALPGFTMTGDCSASERYFGVDGDITEPFVLHDGMLDVPTGPGLGVEPIPDRLERGLVSRERLSARD